MTLPQLRILPHHHAPLHDRHLPQSLRWSDGRPTFAAIYAFAEKAGVDQLGLSDHFCLLPDGTSPDWSLQPGELDAYLADVRSFRGKGKIEVCIGLEFDWFENHDKIVRPFVERVALDYRIGTIHHVEGQQLDDDTSRP